MGIKIRISKKDLPLKYQNFNLIETTDGISDSVYLLNSKYVLKIFENGTKEQVLNECNLLTELKSLPIPQIVDIFMMKNKVAAIYTQLEGESLESAEAVHIKQIALFLKQLHTKTTSLKLTSNKTNKYFKNTKLFEKKRLETMIINSSNKMLFQYFEKTNCTLKNNGIIHGDIFLDNVKFKSDKLTGVYDFIEACEGDFLFDLAVVAISWCFNNNTLDKAKLKILIDNYDNKIEYIKFQEYIKYALLYYATTRYLNSNDYLSLIKKLEGILNDK